MDREELQKEFDRFKSIIETNEYISKLLIEFKDELWDLRNGENPASIKHHHNNKYGLLRHTIEVCQILEKLSDMYDLNKSYLLLAGLLHDLGKLYEYKIENKKWVKCNTENINHSQYIYSVLKHKKEDSLAKTIGTHMGKKEWGAIRDVEDTRDTYDWALYLADMISAKVGFYD